VQDYRQLNSLTIKNHYPLPLISDVIDKLKDAESSPSLTFDGGITTFVFILGDEWKAAFKTNRGMFEPLVMFFGLMNSPARSKPMMNTNVVIPPSNVKLGEDSGIFEFVDDVGDKRERVLVLDRERVQLTVVLHRTEFTIFLLNKERKEKRRERLTV